MRGRLSVVLALLVITTACASGASPSTSTSPGSTGPPSSTAPSPQPVASLDYEIGPCTATPTVDFAVLCEATRRITEHHIRPPGAAELAAAARLGLAEATAPEDVPALPETLRCQVPTPEFEPLCPVLAEAIEDGSTTLEEGVRAATVGMFRFALDPFSSYLPPGLAARRIELATGLVPELGLVVAAEDPDGMLCSPLGDRCRLVVTAVLDFTPAAEAGIVAGDEVVAVDGLSLDGFSLAEALARLGRPAGSSTTLTIRRGSQTLDKPMVRQDLRLDPVELSAPAPEIVHIRLNDFSQVASQLLGDVLARQEIRDAEGLILDLRDNPGGLLLAAQAVTSQFVGEGTVVIEERRDQSVAWPVVEGGLATEGPPLAVLVNRGTASAAEIVAAAIQEAERGIVVGTPTFGKGLIQDSFAAPDGGSFVITVARWTTPSGVDVSGVGVQPDVVVEDPPDNAGDPVLDRAISVLGG